MSYSFKNTTSNPDTVTVRHNAYNYCVCANTPEYIEHAKFPTDETADGWRRRTEEGRWLNRSVITRQGSYDGSHANSQHLYTADIQASRTPMTWWANYTDGSRQLTYNDSRITLDAGCAVWSPSNHKCYPHRHNRCQSRRQHNLHASAKTIKMQSQA